MNDIITPTQKNEFVLEALRIAGFTENLDFPRIHTQEHGMKKIVVDLTAGMSVYFMENKQRVSTDDEHSTLAKVLLMITEAEDGKMPTRSGPDEVVNVSKKNEATESVAPTTDNKNIQRSDATPAHIPESANEAPKKDPTVPAVAEHTQPSTPTEIVLSTAPPAIFEPQGMMIQRLTPGLKEVGKIKIGKRGELQKSKKGTEFRPPMKFDHFEVVTLYKDDNGDFIPDAAIMGLIGDNAKELEVSLLYNDPTLNFFTRYNQYKGGKCMCSGDGINAVQADGTKLTCNPDTCPVFATKKCKPNGILSVVLKDAPQLGGVYKFRTTSYNSIRSILSSLFFLQSLTGGILANIPLKMTVAPMSVNPVGSPTAQTIYVVNLIYPGTVDDLRKQTIEIMTYQAGMQSKIVELEAKARVAISAPETKEEIQDAEAEFYPE